MYIYIYRDRWIDMYIWMDGQMDIEIYINVQIQISRYINIQININIYTYIQIQIQIYLQTNIHLCLPNSCWEAIRKVDSEGRSEWVASCRMSVKQIGRDRDRNGQKYRK